jgi:hypothetical protein
MRAGYAIPALTKEEKKRNHLTLANHTFGLLGMLDAYPTIALR